MKTPHYMAVITAVSTLGMIGSSSATAATVLFDDFDGGGLGTGDGTSVNGGFHLVSNATQGTGTVGETPSNATIATAANSFDNTGIVSINSFGASAAMSISATWDVSSQTATGSNNFNATELLLQEVGSNGTGDGTGFRSVSYVEFVIESNGQWNLSANNGGGAFKLFDGGALGGVPNGYSVTLDLNAAGWSVSGTGFNANPSQSGAWSGGFDFTDLQTDLYAAAMIQIGNNNVANASLNIDSILVDVTSIPEPSSTALLGLGGLAMILRRRR